MTHKERFIKTLKCEPIGGQVPTFELVFFLTMEAFGKVHPVHRFFHQWNQMSAVEQALQIADLADVYIDIAKRYDHSAIFVQLPLEDFEFTQRVLEVIREKSDDEYFLMMHGDPTWAIPDGETMMDFSATMYENPEKLNEHSKKRLDECLEFASKLDSCGHLLDGFGLCSDYCFNTNPFFSGEKFDALIVPYLKDVLTEYRKMGYYSIKHTDGNIMPILSQMAECKPDAIHSIDPQGGVDMSEVRRVVGKDIALVGNVNCGMLQTGTDDECRDDVLRSLRQGMETGAGYIFSTSNCVYTGMPLERYEMMMGLWREHGRYDR